MAIIENDRGLEMAMLNRELIDDLAGTIFTVREENQDLRDRVAWLEAIAEVGEKMVRDALTASAADLSALRSLLATLLVTLR